MRQVPPGFRGDAGTSFPSFIYKATWKRTVESAETEERVMGFGQSQAGWPLKPQELGQTCLSPPSGLCPREDREID